MIDDDDIQEYVRPWVELTDQEIELVYAVIIKIRKKDIMPKEQKMFARTIQEFLRKKNGWWEHTYAKTKTPRVIERKASEDVWQTVDDP